MANPRSNIPTQALIDELDQMDEHRLLTIAQKVSGIDTAIQEYASLSIAKAKPDYYATTLADPVVITAGISNERKDFATALVIGNPIIFRSPFSQLGLDGLPIYGLILPVGIDYIDPNTNLDTRVLTGFTAFSAIDGLKFFYFASEPE